MGSAGKCRRDSWWWLLGGFLGDSAYARSLVEQIRGGGLTTSELERDRGRG